MGEFRYNENRGEEMTEDQQYSTFWRNKCLREADSLAELVTVLKTAANALEDMMSAGVQLERLGEDHYMLYTDDPAVAAQFGLEVDEIEDFEDEDEDDYEMYVHGGEA
jgi:hypothetical protein